MGRFIGCFFLLLATAFAYAKKPARSSAKKPTPTSAKAPAVSSANTPAAVPEGPYVPFKNTDLETAMSLELSPEEEIKFPNSKLDMEVSWRPDALTQIENLNFYCPPISNLCTQSGAQALATEYPVMVFDPGHNECPGSNRTEFPGSGRSGKGEEEDCVNPGDSLRLRQIQSVESGAPGGASKYLHEGKGNLVQAMLARYFLNKCIFSLLPAGQRPPILLTHYPTERYFGEYLAPSWADYAQTATGGDRAYVASQISFEDIPHPADRVKLTKQLNGNFLTRWNHRGAYSNFLVLGAPADFANFALAEFFPWGIRPTDLVPEEEENYKNLLPIAEFKKPGLLVSFHSETANHSRSHRIDTLSVFYPRTGPERAPLKKELTATSLVEIDPSQQRLASVIADSIIEQQLPYFRNITGNENFRILKQVRPKDFYMLHSIRSRHSILIEAYDATGNAREHMEGLVKNGIGQMEVRVIKEDKSEQRKIYPLYPLALGAARGFIEGLATQFCLPK